MFLTPDLRRGRISALIAAGISLLPLLIRLFYFLWIPGNLALTVLFGSRHQILAPAWQRIVSSFLLWMPLLYFGWIAADWGKNRPYREPESAFTLVFWVWVVLLIPWLPFAGLSGMAFDGGDKAVAYAFVGATWTYPITVLVMAFFRRRVHWIVLLPFAHIGACFVVGSIQ